MFNAETFAFPVYASKAARELWFRSQLGTSPDWAVWGLVTVYAYQTEDEKQSETTAVHNNVGFTGTDGNFLTSLAKQWKAKQFLSPKQVASVLKNMPKYAGQLIGHLEGKGVSLVVDKKLAKAAIVDAVQAQLDAMPDDESVQITEPTFASEVKANAALPAPAVSFGNAPAAKPGEPDWPVYRKVLGLSSKLEKRAEFHATVEQYIEEAEDFAKNVWGTVKAYTDKIPSYKQGKLIAVACAKVAAGLSPSNA